MQSPQQFMELLLREQAQLCTAVRQLYRPFEQKFYEPDYLALYVDRRAARERNPETILSVEDTGNVAKVVTTGPGGMPKRYRYHLRRSGPSWRVFEREWQCLGCGGTGKQGDNPCEICHGTGWKDTMKNDR